MNKVLQLNSDAFIVKKYKESEDEQESITIEGYASTVDIDRHGDVVPKSVWDEGIKNFLLNPVILAHHKYTEPVGRMIEHKVDEKGLWIKARISAAAEDVYNRVKDGLITAFSIGFRVLDAEYNAAAEVFLIKKLELLEVSVVAVPANQNTLFNLAKAFDNAEELNTFKKLFSPKETVDNSLITPDVKNTNKSKEWNMNPEDIKQMLADSTKAAVEQAMASLKQEQEAAKKKAEAEAAAEKELNDRVAKAVAATVTLGQSGAEKLVEDVKKAFELDSAAQKKAMEDLRAEVAEKAKELEAMNRSKMSFQDKGVNSDDLYKERETAYILATILKKSIDQTKYGRQVIEKVGAHLPSATWELEVSRNMEAEVRRRLVVAPLLRAINMQTNVMTIPINPEAGIATWVTNAQFGTTASTGAYQTHQLKEITLNAYKVATAEYMAFEEEEDSLLAILPIVRDAMVRRVAKAVDKAYLLGAGAGADPVKGIALYDATSTVVPAATATASIANLRSMRKDMGAWGLDPSEIVYIVSTEIYYDLLDDTSFQTMDKVGAKATLLTGQVGSVGNSPILVSDAFPTKAGGTTTASTNIGAICFAPANFIAGNQRGLRFDTDDLVETQRKVLVASLRTGLVQTTTNLGPGVSTLRWS